MSVAETPDLLYFTLEERNKGLALVAKVCDMIECAKPLGHVTAAGLLLSGKHRKDKDGLDSAHLTPKDLRLIADFVERLQTENVILGSEDKERAA